MLLLIPGLSNQEVPLERLHYWCATWAQTLGDFAEHLGAGYISGTRSHRCCQSSFMTPPLGIVSNRVRTSLTSRWKICLYSPLEVALPVFVAKANSTRVVHHTNDSM